MTELTEAELTRRVNAMIYDLVLGPGFEVATLKEIASAHIRDWHRIDSQQPAQIVEVEEDLSIDSEPFSKQG